MKPRGAFATFLFLCVIVGAILLVRRSMAPREDTSIVDLALLPNTVKDVSWFLNGSWILSSESDPEQVKWVLEALEQDIPPLVPPAPDVAVSPEPAGPFALCRADGKVLVGDISRLWASQVGQELLPRLRREWGSSGIPVSLRLQPASWHAASFLKISKGRRGPIRPGTWKTVDKVNAERLSKAGTPVVSNCPNVLITWSDPYDDRNQLQYADLDRPTVALEIRFSPPVPVSVVRVPWDPYYYAPQWNGGKIIERQTFVTRALPARCDRIRIYPYELSDGPSGSAHVLYHLVGEDRWWYVGLVAPAQATRSRP